jgi:hypothetical protein
MANNRLLATFLTSILLTFTIAGPALSFTSSGPIVIKGQNGTVISGLMITSTGDCVQIINSTNITIKDSQIGPCGTDGNTSNGHGVTISGSHGVSILDNYIHVETLASGCCDSHDGILTTNTSNVTILGNVIAYNETNIEAQSGSSNITINGNFLLNPRGPFPRGEQFQAGQATNIVVINNYTLSTLTGYKYPANQEDALSFWRTNTFSAENNYIIGGFSPSGCGVLIDDRSNYGTVVSNILSNTGQCGIGVGDGVSHLIDSNKVLNLTPVAGAGNTAIYVWKQYFLNTLGCGGSAPPNQITVSNNFADEVQTSGYHSGWWYGGGCGTVKLVKNVVGQPAYTALYPTTSTYPPPAIPPQPSSCVAISPYSTQTSLPQCTN